jgi:hypothetical protein
LFLASTGEYVIKRIFRLTLFFNMLKKIEMNVLDEHLIAISSRFLISSNIILITFVFSISLIISTPYYHIPVSPYSPIIVSPYQRATLIRQSPQHRVRGISVGGKQSQSPI